MNALSQEDSVVDFDMDDIVVQAIANARNTEDPQKVETPTTKSVLTSSSSMADSCDDEGYDAGDRQPYVVRGIVGRSHAVRPALFPDSTTLADVDSKRSDVQKSTRKRNVSLRTISPKERPIISKKEAWDDGGNDLDASCGSLLTSQSIVTESATSGLFSITDSIDDVSSVRDSHAVPPPPTPSSDAPKRKRYAQFIYLFFLVRKRYTQFIYLIIYFLVRLRRPFDVVLDDIVGRRTASAEVRT